MREKVRRASCTGLFNLTVPRQFLPMFLQLLDTELWSFSDATVTVGSLLTAIAVFAAALLVSWLFRSFLERLRRRARVDASAGFYVITQIARYLVLFIGLVIAASVMGLDLTTLSVFAGALGVGIGLGVQDIVKDFFAGLVLLFDRSVEVGDFIELDTGDAGAIKSIGARATNILTNDNVDVLIPNSMLITNKLTNWTRGRATRRIHVPFSVAYGSDKEKVREAGIEAAKALAFTLPDTEHRRTQVWLVGFGDSSLDFELVVWPRLEAVKRPGSMMAAYRWAIDDALRKHGLEIPFPQRDLRIRSFFGAEAQAGVKSWHGDDMHAPRDRTEDRSHARPSTNDAESDISRQQAAEARAEAQEGIEETAAMQREAGKAEAAQAAGDQASKREPR